MRHWRNGKRVRLLSGRSGFNSSVTHYAPLEERLTRQPLKLETPGSAPGRSTQGPMVYGLGSLTFNQRDGVRISVGSLRAWWKGTTLAS